MIYKIGKISIFIEFLLITGFYAQTLTQQTCNGFPGLCTKRYNEIVQITTHNAASTVDPQGAFPNIPSLVQDQDLSIEQQLNAGVRSFEFHIHYDYVNPLGYYTDMLNKAHQDVTSRLNAALDRVKSSHAADFQKIANATAEVNKWQSSIDDLNRQIRDLDNWWNSLPKFSLTGDSQTVRAIDYGTRKGAFEASVRTAQGFKDAAVGVLNAAKTTWENLIKADPEVAKLQAELLGIDAALKITTAGGPQISMQQYFVCHGLPKADLYAAVNSPDDLLRYAPEQVKSALRPFAQKLIDTAKTILKAGFGQTPTEGASGIIPYTACLLDSSRRTLQKLLTQFNQWLDAHPNEVVTLYMYDFAGNNNMLAQAFTNSGILKYAHVQDKNGLWPTLAEMISNKKRLVVFKDSPAAPELPWVHDTRFFFPWGTKFGYKSPSDIINEGDNLANILPADALQKLQLPDKGEGVKNKLFYFTHSTTPGIAGTKEDAAQVNAKNVLLPRLIKLANALNHVPNFPSVDFFEQPNYESLDAANQFNGVGKYAGKPAWQPKPTAPRQDMAPSLFSGVR